MSSTSTPEFWKAVSIPYIYRYSARKWKANFCICVNCCASIGTLLLTVLPFYGLEPKHILWALYHCKVYSTHDVSASWAKCDAKTFRKHCKRAIFVMVKHLPDFDFEDRFDDQDNNDTGSFISVDCTCCPVQPPSIDHKRYFCGKCWSYNLKYEVGINISNQKIVWTNGPFPSSVHDIMIARSRLLAEIDDGELIWVPIKDTFYKNE